MRILVTAKDVTIAKLLRRGELVMEEYHEKHDPLRAELDEICAKKEGSVNKIWDEIESHIESLGIKRTISTKLSVRNNAIVEVPNQAGIIGGQKISKG